jgi:hypothetical protein
VLIELLVVLVALFGELFMLPAVLLDDEAAGEVAVVEFVALALGLFVSPVAYAALAPRAKGTKAAIINFVLNACVIRFLRCKRENAATRNSEMPRSIDDSPRIAVFTTSAPA